MLLSAAPRVRLSGGQRGPRIWLVVLGFVFCTIAFRQVSDLDFGGTASGDPRIFERPEVVKAPEDSRKVSFTFTDARGTYERREFPSGNKTMYVNVIHTQKGHMRSGDVHKCEQLNHIVFGRVTLTQLVGKREVSQTLVGGDVVRVPPHVPHLYSYEEDTLMTETWRAPSGEPCEFEAWLYTPFRCGSPRDRIPKATTQHSFTTGQ